MKSTLLLLIFSLCLLLSLHSQEISVKYGKITNDEMNMTVYAKDTTAAAVVLYNDGYTCYDYKSGTGFNVETDFKKKIKILKQEGIEKATVSIPYYYDNNFKCERIDGLEAIAYNLENGKIVKTKLDKKYLFDEEVNKNFRRLKFSIANVKVGTVIEYKYKRTSPYIYSLPDWFIQSDIPVLNSTYEVFIPEYFIFNIDTRGYELINRKETEESQQFSIMGQSAQISTVDCTSKRIVFSAKDVPALKDEDYVWCLDDFKSKVCFELSATKFPWEFYKPYSHTWSDLEKTLDEETDFTSNIKTSNPYKDEISALISKVSDDKEKIELIYEFIKTHIRWNNEYSFFGTNPKESVKKGTGNNAQINIILMSALKDAGIKTYPILISQRSNGRLPFAYPSLEKLSTFIVAAEASNGSIYYIDGSAVHGGLNMLPTDLLVDRGYIFEPYHLEKWVDLTKICKNTLTSFTKAELDKDGNLKGETSMIHSNQIAYSFKSSIADSKDSTELIDKIQNQYSLTIDSLIIDGKEPMSNKVNEKLVFTKKIENGGDFIYINPMIIPHFTKNDFTQAERKLPIEFNYPYLYKSICILTIPDNYMVEELPKSQKVTLNDNDGKCFYNIAQTENTIQLSYTFDISQTILPFTDYPSIRDFFGLVATKNAEMIVLKKKPTQL